MTKAEELANPHSTLSKAADDEPIFVLRAEDALAPAAVRGWIALVLAAYLKRETSAPYEKLVGAENHALRMEKWARGRSKLPD